MVNFHLNLLLRLTRIIRNKAGKEGKTGAASFATFSAFVRLTSEKSQHCNVIRNTKRRKWFFTVTEPIASREETKKNKENTDRTALSGTIDWEQSGILA